MADVDNQALSMDARKIAAWAMSERIVSVERIPHGVMTDKFIASGASGERCVVRIYPPSRADVVNFEPDLVRKARALGVAAPEVIADSSELGDDTVANSGREFMVYRYVAGTALASVAHRLADDEMGRLASAVVEQIVILRSLEAPGWGEYLNMESCAFRTFLEMLESAYGNSELLTRATGMDAPPAPSSDLIRELRSADPALIFTDLGPGNVIVDDDGAFVSLIDFEGCIGAHAAATLGFLHLSEPTSRWFRAVLDADPAVELSYTTYLYSAIRALRLAPYLSSPLPTGRDRDQFDLQFPGFIAACRALDPQAGPL